MTADLTERKLHGVAVYNPDLLSRDELVAQFVARTELLDEILSDLRRPKFRQHRIIVGTRGMGKTTLLRRIRYAVEADAALAKAWMPVTFPEEQYNVARLSDFYANILDALGDALEQAGRREDAAKIDEAVESLPKIDSARTEIALDVLVKAAKHIDRRLILLVDNLDLVIGRLDESEQWALRDLLSRESRILLIGAMPVIIGATYEHKAPFYDFFKLHELKGLTREETRAVLSTLARQQDVPAVEELLVTDPARIDTLHTLTGGNPRTIVLLFQVLAQGTEGDVRTDLEKLLDQCTPLYKARFEALPPQAQQIVDAVAINWDPISAGELSDKLPLEVNQISSQLNRLVQQGVLEKVEYHPPTKIGFQIAERFFNIWYLMRASRRVRRRLLWLVQFLRLFYGAERLKSKARELLGDPKYGTCDDRLRHIEFCLAVAEIIEDDQPTRVALESHAIRALLSDSILSCQLETMLDLDGSDASLRPVVDREKWLVEFNTEVNHLSFSAKEKEQIRDLVGGFAMLTRAQRTKTVRQLAILKPADRRKRFGALREFREDLFHKLGRSLAELTVRATREGFLDSRGDVAGAVQAANAFGHPEIVAPSMLQSEVTQELTETIQELATRTADPFVHAMYAALLADRGRVDEAKRLLEAIPREARFATVDFICASVAEAAGEFQEAVALFRLVVAVRPKHASAAVRLAGALLLLGENHEAFETFERALQLRRSSDILCEYASALVAVNRSDRAEALLREVLASEPAHEGAFRELTTLLLVQGRLEDAAKLADAIPAGSNPNALIAQAFVYVAAGRSGDALALARGLVANTALPSVLAIQLIPVLAFSEATDEALAQLRRTLRGWPAEPSSRETAVLVSVIDTLLGSTTAESIATVFSELDVVDRFRAIYEALLIVEAGDRDLLNRLAPELQQPGMQILDEWLVPTAVKPIRAKKGQRSKRTKK